MPPVSIGWSRPERRIRVRGTGRGLPLFLRPTPDIQSARGLKDAAYTDLKTDGRAGIPKGFRNKAQGCEHRATLGKHRASTPSTSKRLCPIHDLLISSNPLSFRRNHL